MLSEFIVVDNVRKTYGHGNSTVYALNGVSLAIQRGEIVALLGVNGAGKTTLSSLLATLHPPTTGDIRFHGTSIYKNINTYRRALGFCPQRQNLDTELTVYENLLFAGRYFLMDESAIATRIAELMAQLELTAYAAYHIEALSGGTKQRVLIARALMHKPQLLLLDEPTVGLDPDIRRKLWSLIKELQRQGLTVILTTHYLDEAEALADRVCILDRGSLRLNSTMHELKEQHQRESLEMIFLKLTQSYNQE